MIQTIEAVIDEKGKVQLLQDVRLPQVRRALVTILEEKPAVTVSETALLSEAALAEDWNRPEEDEAWSYLQSEQQFQCVFHSLICRVQNARPAIVLAETGRNDWVLCQVTSQLYNNPLAVKITNNDLVSGAFRKDSYARPGKLFTANEAIITKQIGELKSEKLEEIIRAIISLLEKSIV